VQAVSPLDPHEFHAAGLILNFGLHDGGPCAFGGRFVQAELESLQASGATVLKKR